MTVEIVNQTVVRVQVCPSFAPVLYGVCTSCGQMEEITKAQALTWDAGAMCATCEDEHAVNRKPRIGDWRQPWLG